MAGIPLKDRKNDLWAEMASATKRYSSAIVVSHYNPDADAYGSSCALTLALNSLGINTVCLNESGIVDRFRFIPGVDAVIDQFPRGFADLIIAVDCGDMRRVGDSVVGLYATSKFKINIDHHASNDYFGDLNFVLPEASSTCEILMGYLDALGATYTPEIATALFAGISSDTGSFKYSSTSSSTFAAAARLISYGANLPLVTKSLYQSQSMASIKLQGESLAALEVIADGKVALTVITEEMLKGSGADSEDVDSLKHIVQSIDGVLVSAVIHQNDGIWRVSLRSRSREYNVSKIAGEFGGGGHESASGFRWRGALDELKKRLVSYLVAVV